MILIPSQLIAAAIRHAEAFTAAKLTATEFEARLVALGFYNVEFVPPAAAWGGVRYDLKPRDLVPWADPDHCGVGQYGEIGL